MMKRILDKVPSILKNFYVLSALIFLIWILFFDSNDLVTQIKLSKKESELEKTKAFYEEKILEVKEDRKALLNDEDLLEKVAREKYFMKKPNEEVFVVVEEE